MNTIQKIIKRATQAEIDLLPVIERIMREDLFHGPLDWQTAEELSNAAKQAKQIYYADKEFHDADTEYRKARWARIVAEQEVAEAPDDGSLRQRLAELTDAERDAVTHLESFYRSTSFNSTRNCAPSIGSKTSVSRLK